jgi:hypothetical protein
MLRSLAKFSESEASNHAPSLADFITTMVGFKVFGTHKGHVGAVAFSRKGDPATGDFSDAKVIRAFGEVPNDLNAL